MNEMRKIPGLKDADLFRQAALIGGDWVQAEGGATVDVIDAATSPRAAAQSPSSPRKSAVAAAI